MPQADPQQPDPESKSQKKRDMLALQKLGEELMKLKTAEFQRIDMPDSLREAILHAKSLTSNEAKRRQLQYIGKLMREIDAEAIKQALAKLKFNHQQKTQQFHHIEAWRDKLISHGDSALNEFVSEYPNSDRQQIRQLVRKAQQDKRNDKNTGAETALFRFLRNVME